MCEVARVHPRALQVVDGFIFGRNLQRQPSPNTLVCDVSLLAPRNPCYVTISSRFTRACHLFHHLPVVRAYFRQLCVPLFDF